MKRKRPESTRGLNWLITWTKSSFWYCWKSLSYENICTVLLPAMPLLRNSVSANPSQHQTNAGEPLPLHEAIFHFRRLERKELFAADKSECKLFPFVRHLWKKLQRGAWERGSKCECSARREGPRQPRSQGLFEIGSQDAEWQCFSLFGRETKHDQTVCCTNKRSFQKGIYYCGSGKGRGIALADWLPVPCVQSAPSSQSTIAEAGSRPRSKTKAPAKMTHSP